MYPIVGKFSSFFSSSGQLQPLLLLLLSFRCLGSPLSLVSLLPFRQQPISLSYFPSTADNYLEVQAERRTVWRGGICVEETTLGTINSLALSLLFFFHCGSHTYKPQYSKIPHSIESQETQIQIHYECSKNIITVTSNQIPLKNTGNNFPNLN